MAKIAQNAKWHEPIQGLRVAMLPYIPFGWAKQREKLMAHIQESGEEWDGLADTFILGFPLNLDVEVTGELPAWANVLAELLKTKSHDIVADWETFRRYIAADAVTALWACFENTRDGLPKADRVIQAGMPVPVNEETGELSNPT